MILEEPKEIDDICLAEYNDKMTAVVKVWTNPPMPLIEDYFKTLKEVEVAMKSDAALTDDVFLAFDKRISTFFASVLSADDNVETHWTVENVMQVNNDNSIMWRWLSQRVMKAILASLKKRSKRLQDS